MSLDELAQQLNREAKQPGMAKHSVFEERVRLACIIIGCVGHEADIEAAAIELLNPQLQIEYIEDDEGDLDLW